MTSGTLQAISAAHILPGMSRAPLTPVKPVSRRPAKRGGAGARTDLQTTDGPTVGEATDAQAGMLMSLVEEIAEKRQDALARLYDATVSRIYGVALRIVRTPESAEEVVSDVYMQVWRDAERFDHERGAVMAWLLVITRSRALDLLRKKDEAIAAENPLDLIDEASFAPGGAYDLLAQSRANHALHDALKTLTPLQRQLIALAFFRGLSHSEIEAHTGIALGSVKTFIRRALLTLRETLGEDDLTVS